MKPTKRIRHVAAVVAGLAVACLGLAATASAAFATIIPLPGGPADPRTHEAVYTVTRTVVKGGMPGWQIALIAAGTALVAAALAVVADRARTARRIPAPTAA
jgi:hypothetical protein